MYGPNGIYCGICQQDGHSGIDCTAPLPAWNEEQFQRNQRDLARMASRRPPPTHPTIISLKSVTRIRSVNVVHRGSDQARAEAGRPDE
jgi:hypothetical protein